MPLPTLSVPTYETELPSTGKKIKYRPFLVKEEKLLLLAMDSEDEKTIEDAVKDIAKIFNTAENELNLREFSFKNYKAKKFINGRIIKNGNRALFFEPLEALSGWMYDAIIRTFFDMALANIHDEDSANAHLHELANDYELFIHYMYHGGSVYESEFWTTTKEKSSQKIIHSEKFKQHIQSMQGLDHAMYSSPALVYPFPVSIWKQIDTDMQYHYFD